MKHKSLNEKQRMARNGQLPTIHDEFATLNTNKEIYLDGNSIQDQGQRQGQAGTAHLQRPKVTNPATAATLTAQVQNQPSFLRSKLNNSIYLAKQDNTLHMSMDTVTNVDSDPRMPAKDAIKNKSSKMSNFTNASTQDNSSYTLSKDMFTPYGTKSDLHYTATLNNLLSQQELPTETVKELVQNKDHHEKLIQNYEKQLEDQITECASIKRENELLSQHLSRVEADHIRQEDTAMNLNHNFMKNVEIITRLEQENTAEIERVEVKLHLLEETVTRRSDKQKLVVKEYQNLTKTMDIIDKTRKDCEKRTLDNGDKLKKKLDELNKTTTINYRDTIEMLQEKINHLSNLLAISEEKNQRQENAIKDA